MIFYLLNFFFAKKKPTQTFADIVVKKNRRKTQQNLSE